jgi:thiopeptide-type bacteriocin biosynthesis protein
MPADHLMTASETRWFHARIGFASWDSSEQVMAHVVGPRLDELTASGGANGWWFVRKHPHWRIRVLDADRAQAGDLLGKLASDGTIASWQHGIYEPETHAFGGPAGMDIAHRFFRADSQGVLDYARHQGTALGRRELSVLLISAMLVAARLDWFERGDVFGQVAGLRPAPPDGSAGQMDRLTAQLLTLLRAPAACVIAGELRPPGTGWLAAFQDAGRQLAQAADDDVLTRGLRAILAHMVIFHWNRLGLPAATQGILARAACAACLPGDRAGNG